MVVRYRYCGSLTSGLMKVAWQSPGEPVSLRRSSCNQFAKEAQALIDAKCVFDHRPFWQPDNFLELPHADCFVLRHGTARMQVRQSALDRASHAEQHGCGIERN